MKRGLPQDGGVSWSLWSHLQLQPYSLGCSSALCYFLSSVVYCFGYTCAFLNTQKATFSCSPVNMQYFFGACVIEAGVLLSPSALLQLIFHLASLMPTLHLTCVVITPRIPIVAKAIFYEQNDFLWTHWYTVRRTYNLVSVDWSNPNSHSLASVVPSKANLHNRHGTSTHPEGIYPFLDVRLTGRGKVKGDLKLVLG